MNEVVRCEPERPPLLLVVDDDELLRAALVTELGLHGFRLVERTCGQTALDYLRDGERPDLILLDLVMPHMDGWEFRIAQLHDAALAQIPVVALSGDRSAKARALHADAFLPKPIASPLLLETVDAVLKKKQQAADADLRATEELSWLAQLVDETIAPIRLANEINQANLDAALDQLVAGAPDVSRQLFWLSSARVAARCVGAELTRAALFAHRHHGQLQESRARVLVVDDDDASRELLVEALRDTYGVNAASSAPEALRVLCALDDYDAVVCRLWMPGMTGADLLFELSRTHPGQAMRILFLSNGSEREWREEQRLHAQKHLGVQRGTAVEHIRRAIEATRVDLRH